MADQNVIPSSARLVSSGLTFLFKWVLPGIYWLVTIGMLLVSVISIFWSDRPAYLTCAMCVFFIVWGFVVITKLTRIVDEVWLDDTAVYLRNDGHVFEVKFAAMHGVEGGPFRPVGYISLLLEQPSPWGERINFLGAGSDSQVVNPIMQELRHRITMAKRKT